MAMLTISANIEVITFVWLTIIVYSREVKSLDEWEKVSLKFLPTAMVTMNYFFNLICTIMHSIAIRVPEDSSINLLLWYERTTFSRYSIGFISLFVTFNNITWHNCVG
jgi:hypothetical protein